ncbi:SH3 domain-containing protein [Paraferrimonas haliotis]|uniref:SH3 domain-containing protein n=1 Tax=Paraferrimonas haliotis TaxID=2013866 RepID=UPI000BA8F416|nr:SH3 domain-containing protein [Paraferrimonas haliotis]
MNKDYSMPSWASEVQSLVKQYESVNKIATHPTAISKIQEQMNSIRKTLEMQEPKWLASVKALAESNDALIKQFEKTTWNASIKRFEEANRQAKLAIESSTLQSGIVSQAKLLADSYQSIKKNNQLRKIAEQSKFTESVLGLSRIQEQAIKALEVNGSYATLIESAKKASKLYNLKAFDSISKLNNSPLEQLNELAERDINEAYVEDLQELDNSISSEISNAKDFEQLPASAQNKIIHYLKYIFLTIFLNLASNYIYEQKEEIAAALKNLSGPAEVKSFVRKRSAKFEHEVLSGMRVVSGNNVNLRTSPAMKSEVILQLDTGTLIEVIDRSNRAWLLVEVKDGDDFIQGWISRRYTIYFK